MAPERLEAMKVWATECGFSGVLALLDEHAKRGRALDAIQNWLNEEAIYAAILDDIDHGDESPGAEDMQRERSIDAWREWRAALAAIVPGVSTGESGSEKP